MDDKNETYYRLLERYQSGQVPWDDALPPPEVLQFVPTLPPGRALDLGTGYGRAAIFMAGLGWEVDAVDYLEIALAEAKRRADAAGVRVNYHLSRVTELDFLSGPYDFVLDVGCMHNLDEPNLRAYHGHLLRLMRPGATFLLFVHLREPDPDPEARPHGVDEELLQSIFAEGFNADRIEYGSTQVEDKPPWPSAWFWFRRQAAVHLSRRGHQ